MVFEPRTNGGSSTKINNPGKGARYRVLSLAFPSFINTQTFQHEIYPDELGINAVPMKEKKPVGWQKIRGKLREWDKPALIALIKDLYDASPHNRDFLQARFQAEENEGAAFDKYRRRIVEQFFPSRGFGDPKLTEARKAIRDYRKETGNLTGTIDLMLTYVESGTKFTRQYGDIDAPFYNSMESVLNEFTQLLLREASDLYPRFWERIQRLTAHADHIGWGFGDALLDYAGWIEDELASGAGSGKPSQKQPHSGEGDY